MRHADCITVTQLLFNHFRNSGTLLVFQPQEAELSFSSCAAKKRQCSANSTNGTIRAEFAVLNMDDWSSTKSIAHCHYYRQTDSGVFSIFLLLHVCFASFFTLSSVQVACSPWFFSCSRNTNKYRKGSLGFLEMSG